MSRRRHHRLKLKSFYVWHRYMGITAAIFAVLLSITGIALNHTEELRLDESFIEANWLLNWYGIEEPQKNSGFQTSGHWITLVGDRLYVDGAALEGHFSDLAGAVTLDDLLIVIADGDALLLTGDGELVERLGRQSGVPAGITEIGRSHDAQLVARASHGFYTADDGLLRWHHIEIGNDQVSWSRSEPVPAEQLAVLKQHYRGNIIPLERVLLDLHSGRIFGKAGPWVMDAAAVLLIALALTGTFIWIKWLKRRRTR